jgi:hypothetical protein
MSIRHIAPTAAALLALTACAIQPRPQAAAPTADASAQAKPLPPPKLVCLNEAPTGSHIAERTCRPIDDVERERQATQVELLRPRNTPAIRPGASQQ